MEITIGVKHVNRELTLESEQTPAQITKAVDKALEDGAPLVLEDEKGRQVVIPSESLAYVEIGAQEQRRIGIV